MNTWHITSRLPDEEPNAANFAAYSQPQLIAGASPDARYLFDAVYDHNAQCFVLTLLDVNETFGFVENETRLYPTRLPQRRSLRVNRQAENTVTRLREAKTQCRFRLPSPPEL